MELILWRHAEAEPGEPDQDRALSAKGRRQAAKMAQWLDSKLPQRCRILVSPAVRCLQTAEALKRKFKLEPALAPDRTPAQALAAAGWPDSREPVLLVGHQPLLGQTASLLICGELQDWTVRKAQVWWIVQRAPKDAAGHYLRAVMSPDLLA